MTSVARKRRQSDRDATPIDEPVVRATFRAYQKELDAKHDRAERLVKTSRDLTTCSKRIIFLLHRIVGAADRVPILVEAETKLADARRMLEKIAAELAADSSDDATHRYRRNYKWGVQEFVEALSFYHYCKSQSLIGFEETSKFLEFESSEPAESSSPSPPKQRNRALRLDILPLDYVLGIADLTGECMRMCINSVGCGELAQLGAMCDFVRAIYDALRTLDGGASMTKEMEQKMDVMAMSLRKMETTCYNVVVRGSERPLSLMQPNDEE